jgi:penicillin G amidase
VRGLPGFSRAVEVTVRTTPDGPVMDRQWFDLPEAYGERPYVLRSIADDPDNGLAGAVHAASKATTVEDYLAALAPWTAPPQNLVVADTAGSIGLISPARYPARDAQGRWVGDVPAGDRLMASNPAAGFFATANNLQIPEGYRWPTPGWHDAYRVARITEVLASDDTHTPDDAVALQADRLSLLAVRLKPAISAATPATDAGRRMQADLVSWNGIAAADGTEGTQFAYLARALGQALYGDELGADLMERFAGPREAFLDAALTDPSAAVWCDDTASTGTLETCALTVGRALDTAAASLVAQRGTDPAGWTWGPVHAARFPHPLFSLLPLVGERFTVRVPFGGNSTSVDVARNRHSEDGYETVHAAGLRFVADLADLDASRFMLAPGQSGHPGSPFYRNLALPWSRGETFQLRSDWGPDTPPQGSKVLRLSN